MKLSKYLKASSIYFIGNIFDKALAFVTVPIFTRLLTKSEYGIASTYLSWVSILSVIITLSLGTSLRTAAVDFKKDINKYLSSIFCLGTICAAIITLTIILTTFVFDIAYPRELIVLCCLHAYSASIITGIQWKYIVELNYIRRTLVQCIPNLAIILISIYLIKGMKTDRYYGKIYAYCAVNLVFGFFFLSYYFVKGRTFINVQYWKYGLYFSLPLIFHSLSNTVLSQSDRVMIAYFKNPGEAGLYSLAVQFGLVPTVIISSLEAIWIPFFTKQLEAQKETLVNLFVNPYIYTIMVSCIIIMLIGPDVLMFMSEKSYHSSAYLIAPIILATFFHFLSSISIDLEYYLKKTSKIASSTIFAALLNIVLNTLFIPKYGAKAAACTTIISYFTYFIIHYTVSHKLRPSLYKFRIYIFPIILVSGVSFSIQYLIKLWILRWGLSVVFALLLLCYFNFLYRKNHLPEKQS